MDYQTQLAETSRSVAPFGAINSVRLRATNDKRHSAPLIWIWIFLTPLFFARLFFIGAESTRYEDLETISSPVVGYASNAIVLGYALFFASKRDVSNLAVWLIFPVALLALIHGSLLLYAPEDYTSAALLALGRGLLWYFCCIVFAATINERNFLKALLQLTLITLIAMLFFRLFFSFTGIPLNANVSNGVVREQGFMTEPSAVSGVVGGAVAVWIYRGQKILVVLGVICAFLSASVFTFAALAIGLIVGFAAKFGDRKFFKTTMAVALFLGYPLFIIALPLFSEMIAAWANQTIAYLDTMPFAQTNIYQLSLLRILQAMSSIDQAYGAGDLNGSEGGLFRFAAVVSLIHDLWSSGQWIFGNGFGVTTIINTSSEFSSREFGFMAFLLASVGFPLGFFYFAKSFYWATRGESELALFLIPYSVATTYNAAAGIHGYSVFVVGGIVSFLGRKSRQQIKASNQSGRAPSERLKNAQF